MALLGRSRRGLAQRLGERSEDPVCWLSTGDVLRTVFHSRRVLWAVPRGDIAIDFHRHHGVEIGMVEEIGVVTGYLAILENQNVY